MITISDSRFWLERHKRVEIAGKEAEFAALLEALTNQQPLTTKAYRQVMRRFARAGLPWLAKDQALDVYRQLCQAGVMSYDPGVPAHLQMKPTRTQAGVTTVTVLTKPYPCPGKCIFCPTDARMPKSYLHDEPGAMRAERHQFDPYDQVSARLTALDNIGHPTAKIELLILGGTWSSYKRDYQEWFVRRCFDAMNGSESADLPAAQRLNARSERRNVGLAVETRQDHITPGELRWFRYLGVTKVQIGVQSMDDRILALNKRGHDAQSTRDAFRLLRLAGFKIHAHWMPNLLGATPESDLIDFARLWDEPALRPDELKIYPTMLVPNAELHDYWQRGEYQPYPEETVIDILAACKKMVPRWARINRVVRDIPTTNVAAGFKKTNLRQLAQQKLTAAGESCHCIRCREVRREQVSLDELQLVETSYETVGTMEHFLSFETKQGRLAGFLRLSLPASSQPHPFSELQNHAMIREVHIYGPALPLGEESQGEAQHIGLGTRLIDRAKHMATAAGYQRIAVISAIGTQRYYARHGFDVDGLYMTADLPLQ